MAKVRDISAADYRALAELRYQIRRFVNFSEAQARAAKIEAQQHQLLLVLKALQPPQRPTIGTVAERLLIQHNSAVELVQRSVERKLVERRTDPDDRREASLRITAHGQRVLRRLTLAHRSELRAAAPLLLVSLEALVGRGRTRKVERTKKGEMKKR
jgi:DNA-binding MarR family transcriptional regulator